MKSKKVCIISKFLYENDTRLQQQVATLSKAGTEVDVLCLLSNHSNQRVDQKITIHGVTKPSPKETIFKYFLSTFKFAFVSFVKLETLSFKKKFDLIVVHTLPESLVFVGALQKIRGVKILLDVRDTSVELFETKWGKGNRRFLINFVKASANLACRFSDKIITASPGFQQKLIERKVPSNKITIIYNTADTSIFKYDEKREFKKITSNAKIIYHGTVAERFGVDVAIEALALLQSKIPNSQLFIFGFYDDDYKQKLNKLITKLKLENLVMLNKRENLENIYKMIKISDIGIVPYRSDDFMQLALSTKMFEYISSGIPVIAARLRSAEYVFNDTCVFYATPGEPHEFADKIEQLCLNPDLRKNFTKNAIKAHKKVSSEVMSKLYFNIVADLTN